MVPEERRQLTVNERVHTRICVPVCVAHARELAPSVERAATLADVIELRLDCLPEDEFASALEQLPSMLDAYRQPFILTLRPAEQGGHRPLTLDERARFWSEFARSRLVSSAAHDRLLFDIEHDLLLRGNLHVREDDWQRIVCSFHDFNVTDAATLDAVYMQMAATSARILKIAAHANSITDCLVVFRLLERARREGREMIAIAMGEAGIATRILAPSRGAHLTFGALDDARRTAPAQLSADELRRLYRIDSIDEATEIYGLAGHPVAHSVSPHMHNAAFAATDINAVYIPFDVSDADEFFHRMLHPRTREMDWRLRGLSITAPHKSAWMSRLDWVEASATEIGAVNTVVIRDNALHGYNTDAPASLAPLAEKWNLRGARVAILGAGGAARATLWSLRERGVSVTVFARDAGRARETARQFGASVASLDGARFAEFDIVINATPLGTRGRHQDRTPALANQLRGAQVVYDLVYNPSETRLLREARDAGCETLGGLPMLVAQAAAQFKLWTGHDAPVAAMRDAATKQLAEVGS